MINQHEVVGKDEDDESGGKAAPACCLVLTLSSKVKVGRAAAVVPVQCGASRSLCSNARVPSPCHRAVGSPSRGASSSFWAVARSPSCPGAQWPAPGSCSMLDGASSIYSLRQIETIAILKPRAQTSRGPSSPARLLRELVMHIAGDRHQVAGGGPMIWGQNNPLGWIRSPCHCNCLMRF